jgi:hypothetical protein
MEASCAVAGASFGAVASGVTLASSLRDRLASTKLKKVVHCCLLNFQKLPALWFGINAVLFARITKKLHAKRKIMTPVCSTSLPEYVEERSSHFK